MNIFDNEVVKIKAAASVISSSLHLVANPDLRDPFDLTVLDLKQSETSLREAADRIAMIRTRLEGF